MTPHHDVGPAHALRTEEVVWLLGSLAGLHRKPFDAELLTRRFAPPWDLPTLIEALAGLGLKAHAVPWPDPAYPPPPLPAVAFARGALPDNACTPLLVASRGDGPLGVFRPGEAPCELNDLHDLSHDVEPWLLLCAEQGPRAPAGPGEAGSAQAGEPHASTASPGTSPGFGFAWFIPELVRHRQLWRDVLLASLAIQLVALATPLFTQVIIDKVIAHHSVSTLWVLGVALVVFMLFTSTLTWLRQYLVLHTGSRMDAVLGEQVMRHLLRLPLPYFEARPTGTLVARLQGVETLREFVSGAAVTLLLDLPFLFIFLAVMFWYSWVLSLVAVGLLLLIVLVSLLMVPVFRQRLDRQFLLGAHNQAFLTEYLSGMATVKALQMEPDVDKRHGTLLAQYLQASFATRQLGNTYQVCATALEQTMTLAILIVGAWTVMHSDAFTVGMLVAFQMFASRLSQPLMRLVGLWQEFQQASVAVQRLADVLDMPTEPVSLVPRRAAGGTGHIEVQNLGFRYSQHHPWLYQGLNLTLPPRQLTVLMGPSGCGKSTLAKLLLGFHLAEQGRITLDGHDIRHLAANELRAHFGVVPQETVLFSGTVLDNLLMAHPHASFEDAMTACRAAEIHHVIEQLPQGYQTEIGERGTGLSGGQRQRIAIARALLKRPQVLIFDEAVSNLDQETAELFAQTINRLKGKATLVFITHQVPRGLAVDAVIRLDERKNSEGGNIQTP
ncbi:MAG: peptidase domain-containing ABC transporter [Hydrogenophaga sp.]|uniref:peptidase domain-containing ABC transporter n=1 Tax=Hydrogenophaga sp. TaxID=1904254 RepID=UPI0026135065|nr:peptidase domain-containing ABC transporter [Hydrogenophaga sp.]MDM7943901.1 peptidase domain-containing ABC transporter [Hydrogenophaga sp.]